MQHQSFDQDGALEGRAGGTSTLVGDEPRAEILPAIQQECSAFAPDSFAPIVSRAYFVHERLSGDLFQRSRPQRGDVAPFRNLGSTMAFLAASLEAFAAERYTNVIQVLGPIEWRLERVSKDFERHFGDGAPQRATAPAHDRLNAGMQALRNMSDVLRDTLTGKVSGFMALRSRGAQSVTLEERQKLDALRKLSEHLEEAVSNFLVVLQENGVMDDSSPATGGPHI